MSSSLHAVLRRLLALCLVLATAVAASADEPGTGRGVTGYWRCQEGAALVLADRPCGPAAVHEGVASADVNGYIPVLPPLEPPARARRRAGARAAATAPASASNAPPARAAASTSAAARTSAAVPASTARHRLAECRRIGRSLDRLESRQRAGHTGRQGERLRAQQDELATRRWRLRCRATELEPTGPP